MGETIFEDRVEIQGSQDIEQLRVQGHTTQDEPLQTWENSAEDVLAQLTGDGRFQVGDELATPDALLEVQRDSGSTAKPKRGLHSLGQITNLFADVITWAVAELELLGSAGVSGLQTALRARLTHNNTGTSTSAELRAGDFEAINQTGTSGERVGQATGVRGTANNTPSGASAYLSKAVGVEGKITNAEDGDISDAAAFEVAEPDNDGTIARLYGLRIPDLIQGVVNYAIRTGLGIVRLGDFVELDVPASVPGTPDTDIVRLYPKDDGKLYAKDWNDNEYDLTGGGSGAFVGARAARNTDQTIPDATDTIVEWDAEGYDTDDFHDDVTDNSRFTVPTGLEGYYRISWKIIMNAAFSWGMDVLINGSVAESFVWDTAGGTPSVHTIAYLAEGDYVELSLWQGSGSSQDVVAGSWMAIEYLGA